MDRPQTVRLRLGPHPILPGPRSTALQERKDLIWCGRVLGQPERDERIVDIAPVRKEFGSEREGSQIRSDRFDDANRLLERMTSLVRVTISFERATHAVQCLPLLFAQPGPLCSVERRPQV